MLLSPPPHLCMRKACLNYETTKCRFYAKRDNLCFVRTSSIVRLANIYTAIHCSAHILAVLLQQNGKYVLSGISVDHPECPPSPDTTRIKVQPLSIAACNAKCRTSQVYSGSGWVMEPYHGSETQTLVTYIAHVREVTHICCAACFQFVYSFHRWI